MTDAGTPPISHDAIPGASDSSRQGGFDLGGSPQARQALSCAGAKIPSAQFRRSDRPGGDGAHPVAMRSTGRIAARLHADRGSRGRQDHDRAHARARAELRIARRLGERADHRHAVPGVHCQAIMESRHMDVLEMDAASHTGIDDMREIIDSVRYAPVERPLQGLHHRRSAHAVEARRSTPC